MALTKTEYLSICPKSHHRFPSIITNATRHLYKTHCVCVAECDSASNTVVWWGVFSPLSAFSSPLHDKWHSTQAESPKEKPGGEGDRQTDCECLSLALHFFFSACFIEHCALIFSFDQAYSNQASIENNRSRAYKEWTDRLSAVLGFVGRFRGGQDRGLQHTKELLHSALFYQCVVHDAALSDSVYSKSPSKTSAVHRKHLGQLVLTAGFTSPPALTSRGVGRHKMADFLKWASSVLASWSCCCNQRRIN